MSLLQVGVPLGVFLGYVMTAGIVGQLGWRWPFYIQSMLLVPCLVFFAITPT